jgi:hypothetical protein
MTAHQVDVPRDGKVWFYDTATNKIPVINANWENEVLTGQDTEHHTICFTGYFIYTEPSSGVNHTSQGIVTIHSHRGEIKFKLFNIQAGIGSVKGITEDGQFLLARGDISIQM